jgi:hypothetical protein
MAARLGGREAAARPFFSQRHGSHRRPLEAVIIVHSLAISVEQLCARSPDAPSIDSLRPKFCVFCGEASRNTGGLLQIVGHGFYSRQVRGISETIWIVIWVRRFLCLVCGHTMSLLPG